MHPHFKTFAGALLALTLSRSEVPAQGPDSGANPTARVPPQLPVPPVPPVPPSPIEYFRKLIEASPAERGKLLEGKNPDHCRVLTNSIRTYLELPRADREVRLRTMELRYYLTPLLQTAVTNRAQRLASVPDAYREIVRERLAAWDRLPANEQKTLLENERPIRLSIMVPPMPPMPPNFSIPLRGFTSNQIHSLDKALQNWQNYPEAKRRGIVANFERLVDLPEPKKQRALPPLPLTAAEREQMEKTLEKYRTLSPAQRGHILNTFKKFAEMPPDERRQFLRNAESWQSMSADDRERWRHLVNNLPPMPPLPPGFGAPPVPPMPPPPGAATRAAPSTLLATNH